MIENCPICDSRFADVVLEYDNYPLTERWADPSIPGALGEVSSEFELKKCDRCDHFFLGSQLDPVELYNLDYQTVSSISTAAVEASRQFLNFVNNSFPLSNFEIVFDIGANDGTLLNQLLAFEFKGQRYALDPSVDSWPEGIVGFQAFIEGFDYSKVPESNGSRLFIASHVFEHVSSPRLVLRETVAAMSERDLIAIQLPAIEPMITHGRFDQLHHQHFHYFSWRSMSHLVELLGLRVVASQIDWNHYGAGNILLQKVDSKLNWSPTAVGEAWTLSYPNLVESFTKSFDVFSQHVNTLVSQFENRSFSALGAGLMSPIVFYHLREIWERCHEIVDGSNGKLGRRYANTPLAISKIPSDFSEKDVIITGSVSKLAGRQLFSMAAERHARSISFPVLSV